MKLIVLGSKLAMKDANDNSVFFATSTDGKNFWSNEPLRAGTIVDVTQRTAGDKYVDKDGVEQTVKKDGFNLNIIIGMASDLKAAVEAKALLAELDAI